MPPLTQQGDQLRLRGRGVFNPRRGIKGDHLVNVRWVDGTLSAGFANQVLVRHRERGAGNTCVTRRIWVGRCRHVGLPASPCDWPCRALPVLTGHFHHRRHHQHHHLALPPASTCRVSTSVA